MSTASPAAGLCSVPDAGKLAALRVRCEERGRPTNAVLCTVPLTTFLAESSTAAREKLALIPSQRLAFMDRLVVAGTPDHAIRKAGSESDFST